MNDTVLGFVTYGGPGFTRELVKGIRETTETPIDLFAVVGKPDDDETAAFLDDAGIPYVRHKINMGFPYSVNDLYDYAWKDNNYSNLIIAGNDTIPYPYCIDSMINTTKETDFCWISASQFDARSLISNYPETAKYFHGNNLVFDAFAEAPWKAFTGYTKEVACEPNVIKDVQNFCLYTREVFDTIGYTDVNFFPAYYIDNDYARRGVNAKLKTCNLSGAYYFHFWSRVINQVGGGSTPRYFENNRNYYMKKWGGDFTHEKIDAPVKIDSRDGEESIINMWRMKG